MQDKFYRTKTRTDWSEDNAARDDDDEAVQENVKLEKRYSPDTATTINLLDERLIPYDLIIRLLERLCFEDADYASYSSAVLVFMPGMGEIRRLNDLLNEHTLFGQSSDFRIYPLHSTLSSENQGAVFDIPPSGTRKIVIGASNTDITIHTSSLSVGPSHQYCRNWYNNPRHYLCNRYGKVSRDEVCLDNSLMQYISTR